MSTIEEILDATQSLTPDERSQLLSALWSRMSPEEWPLPGSSVLAEAERRSDQIARGEMETASWDEVRHRARNRAGLDG